MEDEADPVGRNVTNRCRRAQGAEVAAHRLSDPGNVRQPQALDSLSKRLLAATPSDRPRAAKADAGAMLEAYGVAARRGPIARVTKEAVEEFSVALRDPCRLTIRYGGVPRLAKL